MSAMRFMVQKFTANKSGPTTQSADYLRVMDLSIASMEYSKKLEDEGKILYHGIVAGSSESFWIVEAASAEEVDSMLKGLPMFPYLEVQVKPLVSTDHVLNEIRSFVQSSKA